MEFCRFDEDGTEHRTELRNRTGYTFHDVVPDVTVGTRYGFRVHGAWDPANGLRHNPAKLLLDPYATAIDGTYEWGQALFGHDMDAPEQLDETDSASAMPKSVVADRDFDWDGDTQLRTPYADTVVYEVHVKGFTKQHPDVPEEIRGTYAGLAHPAAIKHLTDLGVTPSTPADPPVRAGLHPGRQGSAELLGLQLDRLLRAARRVLVLGHGGQQVAEFKAMVKALHAAGLEVIMDVVYNHTAEGNHMARRCRSRASTTRPTTAWSRATRRTTSTPPARQQPERVAPVGARAHHRLAPLLGRGDARRRLPLRPRDDADRQDGEAEKHSAFLDIIHQDPVLREVKMIAEPWDTAGYQVGSGSRPTGRSGTGSTATTCGVLAGDEGTLATPCSASSLGSPRRVRGLSRRSPLCSVDFVTAHDGFTLADLTMYAEKHNEANGEDNNDGESNNTSFNGGIEGPTDDGAVNDYRDRQRRNFLGTLLLSAGVPMILGGDEIARSQGGNNNAYCQDDEISWFDWAAADRDLLAFTTSAIAFRKEHAALRPLWFRTRRATPSRPCRCSAPTRRVRGRRLGRRRQRAVLLVLQQGDTTVAVLLNASDTTVEFALPEKPGGGSWALGLSSDPDQAVEDGATTLLVRDASFTALV